MRDALEFIFSSFWTWAGTVLLVIFAGGSIGTILSTFCRGKCDCDEHRAPRY